MTPDASRLSPHGFFVTGTDTGVGKTLMACALLHGFAQQGWRVAGMKPVACGVVRSTRGLINEDVALLRAAGNVEAPLQLVNPYCFEPPIAPHLAAEQAGVTIDLTHIAQAFERLAAAADVVVVEGVGGFCVPLNHSEDSADLAQYLGLPVILVVGMRLGCLNHALLTAHAIRARGLRLAGWIANRIDPAMAAVEENITTLAERLAAPLLGEVEFTLAPDPQRVAVLLDLSNLG
jgi:dethiobiotin synthetase